MTRNSQICYWNATAIRVKQMKIMILILILTAFTFLNANWELLPSGVGDNLYGVHFTDDNNGYIVGWGTSAGAMVLQTSDAGENWNSTNISTGAFVFSVTSTNANNIYAAGCLNGGAAGAVFKSIDAGGNWTYSSQPATYGLYDVEFADTQIGYTCGWLGKIYKTTNGGNSWSPLNSGTGNVLRWMSVVDDSNVFIVGGSNWNNPNTLFKTTNGSTWAYVTSLGGVVGGVHFFDADTGVIAGGSGGEIIKKTYDGGSNWEEKYSSNTGLFQAIYFTEEGIGWACGNNGRVAKSVDFGETWIELDPVSPSTTLLGIYATVNHVFAVGESGRIFRKEIEITSKSVIELVISELEMTNYPNPFNPSTTISFNLTTELAENAELVIYNLKGQVIRRYSILNNQSSITWNGKDDSNKSVSSGIYFYKMRAGKYTASKKMILLK